jgi:hypothetical protein
MARRGRIARPWLLRGLFALGCVALAAGRIVAADDDLGDARFLAGLRERGLLRLAESYCTTRLKEPDIAEAARADLVIELSRCLAEQAVNAAPDARGPLWQRAMEVTEDFARQHAGSPRLPLVRFQAALGLLARGELARREAQLVVDGQRLLEDSRAQLRSAVRQLEELNDQVEREVRAQSTRGPSPPARGEPGRLSAQQLAALQKNVQRELARAYRNQAECYPADSPDRANALNQAVRLLQPLAAVDGADSLTWKSRIDLIVCYRLLADYQTAGRVIEAVLQQNPPPATALSARAERLRLALAAKQLPEAVSLLAAGREIDGTISADLDYAWLETSLSAWRAASQAKNPDEAAQWQAKASQIVGLIERNHGPYWARQAQMLAASYVQAMPGSTDLALLVRAAENSFRSGQLDDAVAAYDRARASAEKQADGKQAFDLGYVAATIEHQRGRHEEALARYRQTALAGPDQPRAPEAHGLAIYHAAQLAKDEKPATLDRYAALLEEHLQHWPQAAAADKARWKLGRLRQIQRDWAGAIAAYRTISPEDPQFTLAVDAVDQCVQSLVAERRAAGEPTASIESAAAGWFESLVFGPQGKAPEKWSPLARQAALAAARTWLNAAPPDYRRAAEILSAALAGAGDAPKQWSATAQTLLVFSLAGQGRRKEAAELLAQISAGPIEPLLEMLDGLGRVAAGAPAEVKVELAELRLRAVELLRQRGSEVDRSARQGLARIHAQALADAGRTDEAAAAYRSLSEEYPRDGKIQEAYAQLLSTRQDTVSLQAALAKWSEVIQKSEPAGDRWFRAEYAVAELHYRLGNKQRAVQIIKRLQLLYPAMGGPEMKARFQKLLGRCGT